MSQEIPVIILQEGTQRSRGRDAPRSNIMAAKVLAETVRSTIGPRGMDKMMVGSIGDIVIGQADAIRILWHSWTPGNSSEHPLVLGWVIGVDGAWPGIIHALATHIVEGPWGKPNARRCGAAHRGQGAGRRIASALAGIGEAPITGGGMILLHDVQRAGSG